MQITKNLLILSLTFLVIFPSGSIGDAAEVNPYEWLISEDLTLVYGLDTFDFNGSHTVQFNTSDDEVMNISEGENVYVRFSQGLPETESDLNVSLSYSMTNFV
ncbi:MAG: hypothetical protein ACTSW1_10640 [Candidatus Hodarchaeales archaeon]